MLDASTPEIRSFYNGARSLQPTEAEVARVLQCAAHRRTRRSVVRRGRVVVAFALALAVFGSAFAYPASRDALDAFFRGGTIPGTQRDLGSFPAWVDNTALTRPASGTQRLLA